MEFQRRYESDGKPAIVFRANPRQGGEKRKTRAHPRKSISAQGRSDSGSGVRRGQWFSTGFFLCLRDILGLWRLKFRQEGLDSFEVVPLPLDFGFHLFGGGGGVKVGKASPRRRSDEELDSRKYHPGDDARRINWKQFGHCGELFTRIGEREPPPRSRYLIIVDCELPKGIGKNAGLVYLERLLSLAAGCALELHASGARVEICRPGIPAWHPAEENQSGEAQEKAILSYLCQAQADKGEAEFQFPLAFAEAGLPQSQLVFLAPGARRLESILSRPLYGGSRGFFIPRLALAGAASLARSLFFTGVESQSDTHSLSWARPALHAFNRAAEAEALALRRAGYADARCL